MSQTCVTCAYKETRFWEIREEDQPIARLMMRVGQDGQCWPGGAVLLLKRGRIDPTIACQVMSKRNSGSATVSMAVAALDDLMTLVTSGGSTDAFDELYAPGADNQEAMSSFLTEMVEPVMSGPLFETVQ